MAVLSHRPENGYRIIQAVEESSRGTIRLSPATQYTNLHRLVERGLVEEVTDEEDDRGDGRNQRFWGLTRLGRRVLHAEAQRLAADARSVLSLGPEE